MIWKKLKLKSKRAQEVKRRSGITPWRLKIEEIPLLQCCSTDSAAALYCNKLLICTELNSTELQNKTVEYIFYNVGISIPQGNLRKGSRMKLSCTLFCNQLLWEHGRFLQSSEISCNQRHCTWTHNVACFCSGRMRAIEKYVGPGLSIETKVPQVVFWGNRFRI